MGLYRLDAAPHLLCYEGWWWEMAGAFGFFIALYVIGIPALFAWAVFTHKERVSGVITSRFRVNHG